MSRPCFTVVLLVLPLSCTWARRASLDAVDPELRAKGAQLHRTDESDGFRLGSYRVTAPKLERQAPNAGGLLTSDDTPRPVVQHRLDLGLAAAASGRQWAIQCTSQRRQPPSMDYAAALGENRDEIAVVCDLDSGAEPSTAVKWAFRTEAELSHNFAGRLIDAGSERHLDVEVVVWVERFGKIRRHLPDPVAQVRDGDTTVAAMVLSRPEQAWISEGVEPEIAEAALSTMLAIRYLPLGLD